MSNKIGFKSTGIKTVLVAIGETIGHEFDLAKSAVELAADKAMIGANHLFEDLKIATQMTWKLINNLPGTALKIQAGPGAIVPDLPSLKFMPLYAVEGTKIDLNNVTNGLNHTVQKITGKIFRQ
jgi:hypothetical protein